MTSAVRIVESASGRSSAQALVLRWMLPEDAQQGPDNWYILHLKCRIVLARSSGSGQLRIGAATTSEGAALADSFACARVDITVTRRRAGFEQRVETLGMIDGHTLRRVHGRVVVVLYSNYLQDRGVTPGGNVLYVYAHPSGELRLERVDVIPPTRVECSGVSPYALAIAVRQAPQPVMVGEPVKIRFSLEARDGCVVRNIEIHPEFDATKLALNGSNGTTLSSLTGMSSGEVTVTPLKAGTHVLRLQVTSDDNHPYALVPLSAAQPSRDSGVGTLKIPWVFALLSATLLTTVVLLRRMRAAASPNNAARDSWR